MKKTTIIFLLFSFGAASAGEPQVDKAVAAYDDFEYPKAIELLEAALKKQLPEAERARAWLYLGLSRYTVGNIKGAEEAFRKAVEAKYEIAPPADTSPKIVELFAKIKKSIPPPKKEPEVADVTQPDRTGITKRLVPPSPRKRVWTWVALGVGGAAVAGGATFAFLASKAKSDFDKEPWADQANNIKSTVESRALAANILLGVGGAGVVAGLVLFFLEGRSAEAPAEAGVSFSLTPAGASATFRF